MPETCCVERLGVNRQILNRGMLAREWVGWIPPVVERLETHGTGVEHEEPANEPVAEANDFPDHFERHQRAQHARERTEDASLRASGNGAWRRGLGEQTAVSRIGRPVRLALVGTNGGEGAVEHADGGGDKRLLRKNRHPIPSSAWRNCLTR